MLMVVSTVEEHLAHNPEKEGLNPIPGIEKDPQGHGERENGKKRMYDLPVVAQWYNI
jgi:hypothetical protein